MDQATAQQKPPLSFWVVATLGLIWNAFGGYDYWMTRTRNVDYLAQAGDPQVVLTWVDSFPLWAQICWGLGVWGSVAGSVLLLLRSRHAVSAFLVSLVAALLSFSYQLLISDVPASLDTTGGKVIPIVILAIVAFLWQFSKREAAKGLLR